MANCLKHDKKLAVLHHLVEGSSIRSTERLTGVHRDTIMRLLVRTGRQCRDFLDDRLRNLSLRHVQLDEIWTFVLIKQGNLPVARRGDYRVGDQYLFVAFDEDTKLIASYALGKRMADNARRFLMDLSGRLVWPSPHESDPHAFQKRWVSAHLPAFLRRLGRVS